MPTLLGSAGAALSSESSASDDEHKDIERHNVDELALSEEQWSMHLLKLKKKDSLTRDELRAAQQKMMDEIAKLPHVEVLNQQREVQVSYRQHSFPMLVQSWEEQVELCVHVEIRGLLAEREVIPLLVGENCVLC
eukprot:5003957-Amphidinium_carterae.1